MALPARTRRLVILAAKLAIAGLLIGWLLRSGTLDFAALGLFLDRPALLVANVAVFVFSNVALPGNIGGDVVSLRVR